MDLSGIIFVVLALAWAVYLIPKALKHHDEMARTRSIDRFSNAMRVLARREPVNRRDARLVVTPARPAESTRMVVPSRPAVAAAAVAAAETRPVRRNARREAARLAARRRRRILLLLLVADVTVGTLAGLALVPWWSLAIPVALTLLFLALCRRAVRRAALASWRPAADRPAADRPAADQTAAAEPTRPVAPRRAARVDAPYGTPQSPRPATGYAQIDADEDTITLSGSAVSAALSAGSVHEADAAADRAVQMETVAVTVPTVDGGSLWDPLPVTLPTYVSKPRASRTVRTIDLTEPGTWTSGRSEADSRLVEEASVAPVEEAEVEHEEQRAVGS
ncbi:MAG TPA: hypothetical protein VLA97_18285 [Nocardioidaceae bacterium]|nr:hypothetical protein [Nocardioidaceae bacterium]